MSSSAYGTHRIGFVWLLAAVLVVFLLWASWFEIDQTVRAQGKVIPGVRTQIVQVFDGGVVHDIRVREGQLVQEGEVLAVLEQERSNAAVQELRARLASQEAALLRLASEATMSTPKFPKKLEQEWPELVSAQRKLYAQKRVALDSELEITRKSLAIAQDEFNMHLALYETGDVAQVEVMRIEREVIDIQTRLQSVADKYMSEARSEFAKLEEEHSTLAFQLEERQDILKHTKILAPMNGIIKQVRLTTEGGVLRQGDEFLQISPVDEELVIEVHINPADVGQLQLNLPATVKLDAFDSSIFGSLSGELIYISPDTIMEQGEEQDQISYRAHVKLTWDGEKLNTKIRPSDIKAGMTATVDVRTGTRTVLKYLLKPLNKSFSGALTER